MDSLAGWERVDDGETRWVLRGAAQAVPSRIPHQAATRTADEAAAIAEAPNRVNDAH